MIAHVPWYEFWRHGIWSDAQWTHLHAPWWAWFLRVDFALGALFFVAITALLSAEGHQTQAPREPVPDGNELSWFWIVLIFVVPGLVALAFMVWWGYPLLVLGLAVVVCLPLVAADSLTGQLRRARN